MINVAKMFEEARKFDNRADWEQAALELGYTVKEDTITDHIDGSRLVTLMARAEDGSNRGMYMVYLDKWDMKVRGFLVEKPMCGCGHEH